MFKLLRRFIFLVAVVAVMLWAGGFTKAGWRWDLVQQKLNGEAEHMDWPEVWRRIEPNSFPKIAWRWRLAQLKLNGNIPYTDWATLSSEMLKPESAHDPERMGWIIERAEEGAAPCPVGWRTPFGVIWGREEDGGMIGHLDLERIQQIYERGDVRVQPGDIVLDVGGHLGTYTRWALDRGAKKVVAFEPDPVNSTCFERTFEKEIADGRVALIKAAAWNEKTILRFGATHSADGSVITADKAAVTIEVPAVTIDDTVAELGLPRVDFIKMDIEGAEPYALKGAAKTISTYSPELSVCVYHGEDDIKIVPEVILAINSHYLIGNRLHQQLFFY